jgi:hypothetical protein
VAKEAQKPLRASRNSARKNGVVSCRENFGGEMSVLFAVTKEQPSNTSKKDKKPIFTTHSSSPRMPLLEVFACNFDVFY